MNVYLVQHAEAKSKEEDKNRPLTDQGRRDARQVASLAARSGIGVAQIRHSGKTRARQTAEIFGEALSPPDGVVEASGLGPLDDVETMAGRLGESEQSLMLVGHLPFMERLAGQLLAGDPEHSVVKFHKGGVVNVARTDEGWQLIWAVTPAVASA